uniref:rho GTPase-activating protein gacF-like isoform X1 n=1 Tax=Vespula vulgaris TaxID=7454 RepID=UPI0021210089|nr:rho GTPase-activating protein gacF-like isoform X1 [Vespula vulgaris]XP_050848785.1 rho GTPase-activating protein gacF-like isoform X1 [Vespula vulgaris]XP_050848786.1 rho GTPase-activating protein gacF-like isoform X1 [Vespula vulgaris]XP_050848787.1 rho GTPase-activating protein gacF-like isoform X1 [Vespula vulgaris]XP_050848788.1 rho GTPase-activating protein gacF-like isoform X1 [Vespula vulgaris]XP_050848789.1 rho GTPase-activating protein gacF-like isoform X1 [Vespula vulgaris]XP_05
MEAETGRASSHHQGLQLTLPSPGISGLDVVRALHQTVISLRSALDSSREELRRLKESVGEFSEEKYVEVVERLALENHVLRRRILSRSTDFSNDAATSPQPPPPPSPQPQQSRFVPLQVEGDPTEPSSSSADTASATMDASGNKVVVEETAETIRTSGSRRSTGGSSPETEARGTSVIRRVRGEFPPFSAATTVQQEENQQDQQQQQQQQQHSSRDGARSRCILGQEESVTSAIVSVLSKESKEDIREDIQDDVQDDNEGSVVVDRLDIPEKDSEDLSLRSVSDGDNSVFSDNPEPQSPPQQRPMQQQVQQQQHQHQQQQQQQHQHRQQSQSGEQGKLNDQSENDSEELDDIELIFTTDDTCRDLGLQEDLVSITETDAWQQASPAGQPVLLKYTKSAEGESLVCNGDKTSSVEEAVSSQSSSIDREESVDRFDESSSTRLNKMWSQCSVLVETDISKCGVLEEPEHSARHATRRNTLAAPPTAYRPIIHREALAGNRRKSSAPLRPVMDRSSGAKRESGAQTDISALPAQWRSESYLAHKVAHTFTTLPSKFALPAGVPGRLRLSDKTREARRVLLSDISFTSMVPELSRSADHLCHDPHAQTCLGSRGCGHRTPEVNRRESLGSPAGYWPRCNPGTALPSPCDCRLSADLYSSRYRGSLSSIPSPGLEVVTGPPRRHSWRATAASFDTWRVPAATSTPRPTWSSMPSSPTHVHPPATSSRSSKNVPKRTRSKVTFQECPMTRGSLPNLRSDIVGAGDNSGDSTESLIDEAEDYLRRSIDSMLTISSTSASTDYWSRQTAARRRRTRRHSEPDLAREWIPPQDARPYLPKIPRDLKLDHLVKVISPEGRVLQGRVRYVGPVPGREDSHVGVELPNVNGSSDGTFHGRRFFDCEPDRAIFVPFKKVVLAWCTA